MKEALLSIPVPGNLKSRLLALPEVDEIEAADSSSGEKLGLTLDRSLTLAKRFRVALIMAAMFAACRGPLFAASRQLASTILGALLRQRKYIVQDAASHRERLGPCPETAFTTLSTAALFHRALFHRALCHRSCGFRRFSLSVARRFCGRGAARGKPSALAAYCLVLSLHRSADKRRESDRQSPAADQPPRGLLRGPRTARRSSP